MKRIQLAQDRAKYAELERQLDLTLTYYFAVRFINPEAAYNYDKQSLRIACKAVQIEDRYNGKQPGAMTWLDKIIVFFFGK